jgi:hypothetical protein
MGSTEGVPFSFGVLKKKKNCKNHLFHNFNKQYNNNSGFDFAQPPNKNNINKYDKKNKKQYMGHELVEVHPHSRNERHLWAQQRPDRPG